MSEIKQSADSEMMRQAAQLVEARVTAAKRYTEGVQIIMEFGLSIRQQTAARCAEIARGFLMNGTVIAEQIEAEFGKFEVKE